VRSIRQAYQLNESRACGLVGITRWINRYQSCRDPQDELRQRIQVWVSDLTRAVIHSVTRIRESLFNVIVDVHIFR